MHPWLCECGNTSISAGHAQMMAWPAADLSPTLRQCGGRKGRLQCAGVGHLREERRKTRSREAPALLHAVLSVLKKWRKKVDIEMLPEIWVNFCQGDDRKDVSITRAINAWKKGEGVGGGKIVDQGMAQQQENI